MSFHPDHLYFDIPNEAIPLSYIKLEKSTQFAVLQAFDKHNALFTTPWVEKVHDTARNIDNIQEM